MINTTNSNNIYQISNLFQKEKLDYTELKFLLNKYIVPAFSINIYNKDNVLEDFDISDLICPICYNIYNIPKSCSSNKNSHSFCKECIDKFLQEQEICPICKQYFEYHDNKNLQKKLNKLKFKCYYHERGCKRIINYPDYLNHIKVCKYKNIIYKCEVEKYNINKKIFEKCDFRGNIKDMEEHFKNNELLKYLCLFCNQKILKINFREHLENTFNIGIINFSSGGKYLGEIKSGKSEGYGIDYYLNGDIYEGEFINNEYEGYGIFNYSNLDIYKGEFKSGKAEGIGSFYYSDGSFYQGAFRNGIKEGYGILYYSDDMRYEGEFYNDLKDGYGVLYNRNKEIYFGEFLNDLKDGVGIIYYSNGDKYKGEFKNNLREGYGIYYFSQGDIYEGEFKRDMMEGLGIIKYSNGDIYKGELFYGNANGYGIFNFSTGDSYEGQWLNGEITENRFEYKKNDIQIEVELHENVSRNYIGAFTLYLCKLIKKDMKSFISKFIFIFMLYIFYLIIK